MRGPSRHRGARLRIPIGSPRNRLMFAKSSAFLALLAVLPVVSAPAVAAQSQEERGLVELRNTVVNLLQALVERGVMTREQAEGLVKNAQDKAATEAAAVATQD